MAGIQRVLALQPRAWRSDFADIVLSHERQGRALNNWITYGRYSAKSTVYCARRQRRHFRAEGAIFLQL